MKLFTESKFNLSMYQEHEANRWKFLEDMNETGGSDGVGFLLETPVRVISFTSAYILFVCLIGPRFMRNREPFQLKTIIRFYNLLMVFLAAVLLAGLYEAVGPVENMFDCSKTFVFSDQSTTKIYQMSNFILMVRLSEYLDTIFFTLRKKQSQVTFLHVFHHAFVPIYAFWALRTAPTRFNVFIILINSFIHVLMYFYYFLATFQQQSREQSTGPGKRQSRQSLIMLIVTKLLMFKKYMTQLQILQFISLALYALWASLQTNHCGVPWTYIISNLALAFGFLGLFLQFYMSIYKSKGGQTGSGATKRD